MSFNTWYCRIWQNGRYIQSDEDIIINKEKIIDFSKDYRVELYDCETSLKHLSFGIHYHNKLSSMIECSINIDNMRCVIVSPDCILTGIKLIEARGGDFYIMMSYKYEMKNYNKRIQIINDLIWIYEKY